MLVATQDATADEILNNLIAHSPAFIQNMKYYLCFLFVRTFIFIFIFTFLNFYSLLSNTIMIML